MKKLARKFLNELSVRFGNQELYDLMLHRTFAEKQSAHPNPLNKGKLLGFSQNDEDSITLEILRRIGLNEGLFVEFGVGDGLENNTAILLAAGWKGAWFGGEDLAFSLGNSSKLEFSKVWITKENIFELYSKATGEADVVSLDLDGNDIHLAEELLRNGVQPKLFIAEYNGKFPPPIEFQIDYDGAHTWKSQDYFGASLASFNKLFISYDYRLVCCNLTGANAFFVHKSVAHNFDDVPTDIDELYCESFYFLRKQKMHPTSAQTMEHIIK